ncbi:VPLPA-CTERM-specific exosortase XrtD [Paracoccus sediminis]|uniref:Exosortase D, VPLPA-CTERM-specific n=1 Tax=Paracoccus sediminis TaxID=1214787 RepID=A0A238Y6G9_9RHOB|nr:VPLPA-CTERM-specific exosortase XrtD [Paracoccus sediminis]SNR66707.1 exosortase D, VPLPA-CTERM-specific [Paracoccus sediminis]
MSLFSQDATLPQSRQSSGSIHWGLVWLAIATIGAGMFFYPGLDALLVAWQLPEYSHGPLIPALSALLFLRQLKDVPARPGALPDRWPGVAVVMLALTVGMLGRMANISDIVAYATIIWVGGILLISFGWERGKHMWPPVLHLVYMLPLPGVLYYKLSTWLQFVSSELGVWFLKLLAVPVFLEGNVIDLGVTKLHVAEACSGLRYLFPILSFSYIFAVLYRGPTWHKAILLLSAAPITVVMNSVRIAIAGYIVNRWGLEWVEGFTHFFEGWVIFVACVALLFLLAWIMLFFHPQKPGLINALDLETDGLVRQVGRLRLVQPSAALIAAATMVTVAALAWQALPERSPGNIARQDFSTFPRNLSQWQQVGPAEVLGESIAKTLGADDYHQVNLRRDGVAAPVGLFMAWYADQSQGGVHSPEICLPGNGWEIARLERINIASRLGSDTPFQINRAIIQKGETRMMVFYWFEQKGRKVAWDIAAKFYLMTDGITTGRTDGGLVRLTTPISRDESNDAAEARLLDVLKEVMVPLPRFMPSDES